MKQREHLGLPERPLDNEGRPVRFVRYQAQQAAFKFLAGVLADERGIGLLHGPELSGKSVLVQRFAEDLQGNPAVAIVDGARLRPVDLLSKILEQFGYDVELNSSDELLNMVNMFAVQQTRTRQPPLLILESINQMYPGTLCVLCQLASLTVHNRFALRIILVGDRYFHRIIDSPSMKPVATRMMGDFEMQPLTANEALNYLHTKLRASGVEKPENYFSVAVCDKLYAASGGWPGRLEKIAMSVIEETELEVPEELPELRDVATSEELPKLIVTFDGTTLQEVNLANTRALIGRSGLSDIAIDSEYVSRQHALLIRDQDAVIIIDLNSRNGTLVNSQKVMSKVLRDNDIVSIGDHRIKVIYPNGNPNLETELPDLADTASMKNIEEARREKNAESMPPDTTVMSHRR